jgi:chromosome segregation ATPase
MSSEIPAALPTQGGNNATPTKDIKESIAALRSILMIDTPTNTLLSGKHPTVAAQQSLHDPSRQHWEELAKLRNKTVELKTKFHAATTEAEHETRQRKTLQTTYDALSKQRKELSAQLDIVAKSRDIAEEKLATMRKSMNEERAAIAHERVQWRPQLEKLR